MIALAPKMTHQTKKSHTCEEAQNFFLTFIDELEKHIIIKKTVDVGQ